MCGVVPNPKCLAAQDLKNFVAFYGWLVLLPYLVIKTIWHAVVVGCYNPRQYIESGPKLGIMFSLGFIVFCMLMVATPVVLLEHGDLASIRSSRVFQGLPYFRLRELDGAVCWSVYVCLLCFLHSPLHDPVLPLYGLLFKRNDQVNYHRNGR